MKGKENEVNNERNNNENGKTNTENKRIYERQKIIKKNRKY